MKNYIELGPVPYDEDCAQCGIGISNFAELNIAECNHYKDLLEAMFPVPANTSLKFSVKVFDYEPESYREVVLYYDDSVEAEVEFAMKVENNLPATWD